MENSQEHSYFSFLRKTEKYKAKEKIAGEIIDDIYYPKNPYILKKGIGGKRKRFKGKSLEWLLLCQNSTFLGSVGWAKKSLESKNLFKEHILWVHEAFQKLPNPQCCHSGCTEPATYFSIRWSGNRQKSFGLPFIACENHVDELKNNPSPISINVLSPSSVNIFKCDADRERFQEIFFTFEGASGEKIFKELKRTLPCIEIKQKIEPEIIKPANPIQYALEL